ncbi:MAG: metallophosphoesterase [Planctomycetes bacterium]|nr:metallophosphoesterase [Planctomycetota bacterium]
MLRLGIINDLHLGGPVDCPGRLHNRLNYHNAERCTRQAVRRLNGLGLDAVIVNGDVSEHGHESELALAHDIFSGLRVPWHILPGNHDRAAVAGGTFDRVFGGRATHGYTDLGGVGALFLRENEWGGPIGYQLGAAESDNAFEAVARDAPDVLLVFSHVPLVAEPVMKGQSLHDGPVLLERLSSVVRGRVALLTAHLHCHIVTETPSWVQITTGAMVEYPMEVRVVEVNGARLRTRVESCVDPELAWESFDRGQWVLGRARDREAELSLRR